MNIAQHILVFCVRLYRWGISPAKTFLFGALGHCRFTPSCSEYALAALRRHGALAGSWLALKRIGRCHPWGGCGHDPVPKLKSEVRIPKPDVPLHRWAHFSQSPSLAPSFQRHSPGR